MEGDSLGWRIPSCLPTCGKQQQARVRLIVQCLPHLHTAFRIGTSAALLKGSEGDDTSKKLKMLKRMITQ